MPKVWDIYLLTNKKNGKRYVGQSCHGTAKRFRSHCTSSSRDAPRMVITRAIKKWGADGFNVQTLGQCSSLEKANELEKFAIVAYNTLASQGCGYNVLPGGQNQGRPKGLTGKRKREEDSTLPWGVRSLHKDGDPVGYEVRLADGTFHVCKRSDMTMEEKLDAVLRYHAGGEKISKRQEAYAKLPAYVIPLTIKGELIGYYSRKDHCWSRSFRDGALSLEDNLKAATEHVAEMTELFAREGVSREDKVAAAAKQNRQTRGKRTYTDLPPCVTPICIKGTRIGYKSFKQGCWSKNFQKMSDTLEEKLCLATAHATSMQNM